MKNPTFKGDMNKYIEKLCKYADNIKEKNHTVHLEVIFDIFGSSKGKASLAAVSGKPISQDKEYNMGVYRKVLEREIQNLKNDNQLRQQRIDELEKQFVNELYKIEEEHWAKYGEDL